MAKFTKEHRAKLSAAAKARHAKKGKKRGRKPGVKVGPYKKRKGFSAIDLVNKALNNIQTRKEWKVSENQVGSGLSASYTPSQPLTLCGQLEDSILLLENRISNAIAKINSLM